MEQHTNTRTWHKGQKYKDWLLTTNKQYFICTWRTEAHLLFLTVAKEQIQTGIRNETSTVTIVSSLGITVSKGTKTN